MMARAPGVGPKLAARLVLELKDKAPAFVAADFAGAEPGLERRPETDQDGGRRDPRPRWPWLRPSASRRRGRQDLGRTWGGRSDRFAGSRRLEGDRAMTRNSGTMTSAEVLDNVGSIEASIEVKDRDSEGGP